MQSAGVGCGEAAFIGTDSGTFINDEAINLSLLYKFLSKKRRK